MPSVWRLRSRFSELVVSAIRGLGLAPGASVLDAGAGAGALVCDLLGRGYRALGVEPDRGQTELARAAGLPIQTGFAERLPLSDRSVDLAVMRHALHHCSDPSAALADLFRVARVAVLVAEPWHPIDEPGGEISLEFDLLLKSWHRRAGRIHAPNLRRASILDRVESGWTPVPESVATPRILRCTESWTEAAMRSEAAGYVEAVSTAAERHSFERLCRSAAVGGVPRPGSELTFLERGAGRSDLRC